VKRLLFALALATLCSCKNPKVESLETQNAQLRERLQKLQYENAQLRETAQYHFQLGQRYVSSRKWAEACASFRTVISNYPNDPLAQTARTALGEAEREQAAETKNQLDAEIKKRATQEKERAEAGEPIDYGVFFAKTNTGLQIDKRYRFTACINHAPCLNSETQIPFQPICSLELQLSEDDVARYERGLAGASKYCGIIVAGMLDDGKIGIYRLH